MVAAAVIGAAVIGGVASNAAANTQAGAANDAANMQQYQYNQAQANSAPWRGAGSNAVGYLAYLEGVPGYENYGQNGYGGTAAWTPGWNGAMGAPGMMGTWGSQPSTGFAPQGEFGSLGKNFSMADFQADPGYAFRMQEGLKALQGSAAARGGILSGGALKGIDQYSQGLASQEYQNAFGRFESQRNDRYNQLASIAGLGQTANATNSQLGAMSANNAGNYLTQGANAQAAGYIGMGNAIGNGVGNWMDYQNMNNLAQQQWANGYAGNMQGQMGAGSSMLGGSSYIPPMSTALPG